MAILCKESGPFFVFETPFAVARLPQGIEAYILPKVVAESPPVPRNGSNVSLVYWVCTKLRVLCVFNC